MLTRAEIFVLSGELKDEHGTRPGHMFTPPHERSLPCVVEETVVWVKTEDHLRFHARHL
jgi:hypothetical protein